MNANTTCTCCGGPAYLLGVLGNRRHLRCRDCGIEFTRKARPRRPATRQVVRVGVEGTETLAFRLVRELRVRRESPRAELVLDLGLPNTGGAL